MTKLFWCPKTRSFRAIWLLEEARIPYERVLVDVRDPKSRTNAEFMAASPLGKVPALIDGPVRINDSGAMCIYIADAYPDAGLGRPVGHPDRGAFLQWTVFNNSNLEPAMAEKASGMPAKPTTHGWGDFDSMVATARKGLEQSGPYILGEQFSAADIMLASGFYFMLLFKILDGDAEPLIKAYVDRCMARPAAQLAAQLGFNQS